METLLKLLETEHIYPKLREGNKIALSTSKKIVGSTFKPHKANVYCEMDHSVQEFQYHSGSRPPKRWSGLILLGKVGYPVGSEDLHACLRLPWIGLEIFHTISILKTQNFLTNKQ